ncbi:3-isopropylmalate dehydratase, small subunit [Malonomonas rubra DSM 5091]|uniref:3-isopropylmalate dehydratase small subunit n=1 Tax=Malonomonas rubra DSM 5091 TaxID=1122189 RepID=A0A1M6JAS6_MALRU|nr:3-isopropylmalate dehydratase small subunit [Malonomonas rubra]SHJ43784.1 3-isopropylmalate dehydratase, small subunit [Malonomonas rubra DSM 5091]
MEKFITFSGLVAPLDRANVDTDAIIPKQFLKSIERTGFGPYLFDEWRYLDHGEPGMDCSDRPRNTEFVLNQERYQGAQILLTRDNFGCGSSREHAPWALLDFGIKVLIAPSFADIFYNNCFKNGILPIKLESSQVDSLFRAVEKAPSYQLQIDLEQQLIGLPDGISIPFEIDPFRKHCLLNGLDDIGLTLEKTDKIETYEMQRRQQAPWLFAG